MWKIKTITFLITAVFITGFPIFIYGHVFAYSSVEDQLVSPKSNPLDYLQNNQLLQRLPGLNNFNIGTTIPALPSSLPSNFKGFFSGSNFGDFKLINIDSLSSQDLTGSLKSIAVLAINLFLIVIQVVAGILKALLPFLQ